MAKSFRRILLLNLYTLCFTVVFVVIFSTSIISFIPIYIYRFLVSLIIRKIFRPDLGKLVNTRSAVIAGTDDPTADPKWNLCIWLVLDGKLNFEQFRVNFYNNIVLRKTSNGQLHNPEYQQYLYKWLGFMFWKWEEHFNIEDHMRYLFPNDKESVIDEEKLRQVIQKLAYEPFKAEKSPWEFLYIPNYQENCDAHCSKSVLVFRVHHGLCDGFAILHLLMKEVNNISLENVAKPDKQRQSVLLKIIQGTLFWLSTPYLFIKMLVRAADTNEWHLPTSRLRRPYSTGFTPRIPLSFIKEIKNTHKVSFSAVIYSTLIGALRRSMQENGKSVPQYMSTAVAVPMPGHPFKLRNHFIFSFLQLPTGIEDPQVRLQKVERNIQSLKRSPVPAFNFCLIPIVGGTLVNTMKLFSKNTYSTLLTSNFPGPPQIVDFIGDGGSTHVTDMNFAAGLGEGNVGIGFCMLSYNEGIRIITSFADDILQTNQKVDDFNTHILEEMQILQKSFKCV